MITLDSTGDFTFDPEEHAYFLKGERLPSVTQILEGVKIINTDVLPDLEYYRDRGTAIHRATELWDRGTLDEESVDKRIAPYLEAYKRFQKDIWFVPAETEVAKYSETERFAGTLDKVGDINGKPAILDIKTGQVPKWAGVQLAGYALLMGDYWEWKRFGLALRDDGTYRLIPFKDMADKVVFLSALSVYRWKESYG